MAKSRGLAGSAAFSLEGDKLLLQRLNQLDRATRGAAIVEALEAGVKPIIRHAQATAPKRTGELMRSIDSEVGKITSHSAFMRVGPGSETEVKTRKGKMVSYGLFSEWGVRGQKKTEWLKRATIRGKAQFTSIVRLRLRRILLKHTR